MAWAVRMKTGKVNSKALLITLANYANDKDECFPSVKTLSSDTEMSVSTVHVYLVRLKDNGFIEIIKRFREGRQTTSTYRLNRKDESKYRLRETDTGDRATVGEDPLGGGTGARETETEPITMNLSLEPNPPMPPRWGEFENLYPDRNGEEKLLEKAKGKYQELVEAGEDPDAILIGLKHYAVSCQQGKRQPKTATAFLGNKLYNEYQTENPANSNEDPQPDYIGSVMPLQRAQWKDIADSWTDRHHARAWLYDLTFRGIIGTHAKFYAENNFKRDRCRNDFAREMLRCFKIRAPHVRHIDIDLAPNGLVKDSKEGQG